VEAESLYKTNTVIKVKVLLFPVCQKFFILITIAHHGRSIRDRVIALAEKGRLSASTAGEFYGVSMSTASEWLRKYWRDGQVERSKEALKH